MRIYIYIYVCILYMYIFLSDCLAGLTLQHIESSWLAEGESRSSVARTKSANMMDQAGIARIT